MLWPVSGSTVWYGKVSPDLASTWSQVRTHLTWSQVRCFGHWAAAASPEWPRHGSQGNLSQPPATRWSSWTQMESHILPLPFSSWLFRKFMSFYPDISNYERISVCPTSVCNRWWRGGTEQISHKLRGIPAMQLCLIVLLRDYSCLAVIWDVSATLML